MSRPEAERAPECGAPALSRIQRWFQAAVTDPEGVAAGAGTAEGPGAAGSAGIPVEAMITRSRQLSAADRLAVYAHAYHARLLECLGESFPMVKRLLGEEVFNGFASGYLQRYPSRSYTLSRLGASLARHLEESRPDGIGTDAPAPGWPEAVIDLARLEWAIDEVFDGPGMERKEGLLPEALEGIPRRQIPDLRLRPAPDLRLLRFRFPVNDWYTALRGGAVPEDLPPLQAGESFLALTRRDYVVRRHELEREEHDLLSGLAQGLALEDSIRGAADRSGLDDDALASRLGTWFRRWTERGFFEGIA